jgi:RNA polymerase sigma-70 factor, ECF subfamily
MTGAADPFEARRGRLVGLAYRMLGNRADAEDAVQDAWLRWARTEQAQIANPEAWLTQVVTRICLDRLKSARARREIYVGPWLPEPVLDADQLSPQTHAELADDLSFALMLALDRLSPAERAAFLLHDIFDSPFSEVASALDKSEAACRQLAARARKAVRGGGARFDATPDAHRRLLAAFGEAALGGDVAALRAMLTEDVIAMTDGGGRKAAALNIVRSVDKVARFYIGLARKFLREGAAFTFELAEINGGPGLVVRLNGEIDQTLSLSIENGKIAALYAVRNPDKLGGVRQALPH